MDVNGELGDIHNHGESVNNNRVKCRYCEKTMTTFSRLKNHLGDVGTDVTSCEMVPEAVKEVFRKMLLEKDVTGMKSRGMSLTGPHLKRNSPRVLDSTKRSKPGPSQAASSSSGNRDMTAEDGIKEGNSVGEGRAVNVALDKSIGRFFLEMGLDFRVASSPSFQKMINAAVSTSTLNCKIPTSQELQDRFLRDEETEMSKYIGQIRDSWASTGCSLLLDVWIGKSGKQFMNFIVDCPKGAIYLSSADVSNATNDLDSIQTLLDETINKIGVDNLVQVLASSSTGWMAALRDQFRQRCTSLIWSVSVSSSIKLMLDGISSLVIVKRALDGAKEIATFLYSNVEILKLMKYHTGDVDLQDPSWMEFAAPFFTLEKVTLAKENLKRMFGSYEWQNSPWAGSSEGKIVLDLIGDLSFWAAAENAVDSTLPLLKVYDIVSQTDKPFVGYIYETFDQVKETIKKELKGTGLRHQPVWKVIDDIWNNHLHTDLHAAACYLNPFIYYSDDFCPDEEIVSGPFNCIIHMVQDKRIEVLTSSQLEKYRTRQGAFEEGSTFKNLKNVTPAEWWSIYGKHCPELQSFAIRILSQTCDGVSSRYKLDRTLAEKSITEEDPVERARLVRLASVHYNLHLRNHKHGTSSSVVKVELAD